MCGLVSQDPQRALLRFYTTVLRDAERHIEVLNAHTSLPGVCARRFILEPFTLFVTCRHQLALSTLEALYRQKKLSDVVTSVLAGQDVLAEVAVEALITEATLHRAELDRYRRGLRGTNTKPKKVSISGSTVSNSPGKPMFGKREES